MGALLLSATLTCSLTICIPFSRVSSVSLFNSSLLALSTKLILYVVPYIFFMVSLIFLSYPMAVKRSAATILKLKFIILFVTSKSVSFITAFKMGCLHDIAVTIFLISFSMGFLSVPSVYSTVISVSFMQNLFFIKVLRPSSSLTSIYLSEQSLISNTLLFFFKTAASTIAVQILPSAL
ncbi:MAG: hypothetical protein BWY74_03824 [Firmicutes bacterium ADurb.Bin419]|nr:MAG: hypothetical protein BWY74_03824 [Firmicutes bacterium ADurb.Bin419]